MGIKKTAIDPKIKKRFHDFLMNEDDCISIEEALDEVKKKWPKSK